MSRGSQFLGTTGNLGAGRRKLWAPLPAPPGQRGPDSQARALCGFGQALPDLVRCVQVRKVQSQSRNPRLYHGKGNLVWTAQA